jgi:hypothetical protein
MRSSRVLLLVVVCALLGGTATSAAAKDVRLPAREGPAMGLVPRAGDFDIAAGSQTPVVYHAGPR